MHTLSMRASYHWSLAQDQLQRESSDAAFSNATLHWIPQADAVIAGCGDLLVDGWSLRPANSGGHGNVAAIVVALDASRRLHGFDSVGNHGSSQRLPNMKNACATAGSRSMRSH